MLCLCAKTLTIRSWVASTLSPTLNIIGMGEADLRLVEMISVRRWRIEGVIPPASLSQLANSSGSGSKSLANFRGQPAVASHFLVARRSWSENYQERLLGAFLVGFALPFFFRFAFFGR